MSYHPRIETDKMGSLITTRSRNSELWFVNNGKLERTILGYSAKFSERYAVKLYGLAIEGNHMHSTADFPKLNRAHFMRDLNSNVARAVTRHTDFPGGSFWGRRYSSELLPDSMDIEDRFFYTVLQPVQDGLVEKISDYPGYNCFNDAVSGIARKYPVIRWADYNKAKRYNPKAKISDFTDVFVLKYERLPGYEHLSRVEYKKLMLKKLEERRQIIVKDRLKRGLGFLGPEKLKKIKPGSTPHSTKTSTSNSHRPRILSGCPERRNLVLSWYFDIYAAYKKASELFRSGDLTISFPEGTYRPPQVTILHPAPT